MRVTTYRACTAIIFGVGWIIISIVLLWFGIAAIDYNTPDLVDPTRDKYVWMWRVIPPSVTKLDIPPNTFYTSLMRVVMAVAVVLEFIIVIITPIVSILIIYVVGCVLFYFGLITVMRRSICE